MDHPGILNQQVIVDRSEPGPLPRTMGQEVFELNELLKAAKVRGLMVWSVNSWEVCWSVFIRSTWKKCRWYCLSQKLSN